jgi:hypothetical protein
VGSGLLRLLPHRLARALVPVVVDQGQEAEEGEQGEEEAEV